MAAKIQLTPTELQTQAAEMNALNQEFSALFSQISNNLNSTNSSWSANLARNFEGKIMSTYKIFGRITEDLAIGARVAEIE